MSEQNKLHADGYFVFQTESGIIGRTVATFTRAEDAARYVELEGQLNALHELFKINQRNIREEVERAFGREMVSDAPTAVHRLANAYIEAKSELAEVKRQAANMEARLADVNGRIEVVSAKLAEAKTRIAQIEAQPRIVKTLMSQNGQVFALYLSNGQKVKIQREGGAAWMEIGPTPIVREAGE